MFYSIKFRNIKKRKIENGVRGIENQFAKNH